MLKLSSSREIRIDVPVLSVSWSVEDHSVITQALKKGLIEHEASDTGGGGSPLVQIVWQRLQYLDISRNSVGGVWRRNWAAARSETNLKRTAVEDALAGWRTRKKARQESLRETMNPGGHGAA